MDAKGLRAANPGIEQVQRGRAQSVGGKSAIGVLGNREVRQVPGDAPQRPRANSAQLPFRPLGDWRVQIGPGTRVAAQARQAMRQGRYDAALNTKGTPDEVKAAAAALTSTIPARQLFAQFAPQLLRQYASHTRSPEHFTAALDGLLDGLKAIGGGALSKNDITAYVEFASHPLDAGSMESAQRANLSLSRLAVALGANINAFVVEHNGASSVGQYIASTMASLGTVLNDKRPQEAAGLFAAGLTSALADVNALDRQPLLDGVLTRLMTQHGTLGEQGFKALASGLLQGSGVREAGTTEGAQQILDGLVRCAAAQQPQGRPAALPAVLDFCKVLGQELHHLGRDPLRQPDQDARLETTIKASLQPPVSDLAVQAFRAGRAESRPQPVPADPPPGPPPDVKAQSADDKGRAQAKAKYDLLMGRILKNTHQENAQHLMTDIIASAVKLHKFDPSWPTKLMTAMSERLGGVKPDKALITMCLNKFAHAALNETLNPNKDNWELLTATEQQELESRNIFSSKTHRSLGVDNDETVLRALMDGFTQALGGDDMSDEICGHCLKAITHLDYLTLDEPPVVARLFRGLGYKIEEDGSAGRRVPAEVAALLTKNECDKILVATKLCPVDWKLDPSAQARRSARSAASANQPATPVPSLGGDTIVSKLTQSIGQGRAFEVGRELVTARRKNEINPAELKPLAQQIVAQLYQDPTAWRERVTDFMRGWAKAAAEERDDWSSREVLSAIDEAAASDPNANGAPKAEHRQGFVTLAPHVLWEEYVDAETVMNEIAGGQENPNLASWKSFIAVDIS